MKKWYYIIRVFKECFIATIIAIIFISDDRRYYSVYVAVWVWDEREKKGDIRDWYLLIPIDFLFLYMEIDHIPKYPSIPCR